MDIKSLIKRPAQLAQDNGLKVLVYGAAGVGKTTLCASTGAPEKTLILSAEAGLLSIRDSNVSAINIESIQKLRDVYTYLKGTDKAPPTHPYTWVCLDSISEIAEQVLVSEMESKKDPRQAYGEMAVTMEKMIKLFRDLPMNVCMVCKGKQSDDEGRMVWQPSLPGQQLAEKIPYLFDEVFCLVAQVNKEGEVRRALRTTADGKYTAKDRSGRLEGWEAPDLAALYKKIHGPRVASA